MDNIKPGDTFLSHAYSSLHELQEENDKLRQELFHAKQLLQFSSSNLYIGSPEEAIALKQIALLEEQSMIRALTSDEAKRLKIYCEIKLMLKEQTKDVEKEVNTENLSVKELLAIASEA